MKGVLCLAALLGLVCPTPAANHDTHVTKSASIVLHLHAAPDVVFPLFDPVNEMKWDPSWKPQLLGDRIEEGLVFLVGDGEDRATWVVDRYDPVARRIGYVVAGRSTLTRIIVQVQAAGVESKATVTYKKTALDDDAVSNVTTFGEHFAQEQSHWEAAINAVLH